MKFKATSRLPRLMILLIAGSATGWTQDRPKLVQSVDLHIPVAPATVRVAGKQHLVYELHVTNFSSDDVRVNTVEIFDGETETPLATVGGEDLAGLLGRPGIKTELADERVIGGGLRAVLYLWLPLDEEDDTPSSLSHRLTLDVLRAPGPERTVAHTRDVQLTSAPILVLDPPLRGGPWVGLYDPSMDHGHRTSIYTIDGRARIPARFAIDWIRLDEDATHAAGDHSIVANWHGFGEEVLAVADGLIADARDDMPHLDSITASQVPTPLANASGNYISLDLGDGRYAFYEHLQHGSLKVKAGDRVKRGQVIALLGNSGSSSSGPHLHFHVADANATLASEGLPYVFRSFDVIGKYERIGDFATNVAWKRAPRAEDGIRKMELPDANVVLMFPE